MLKIGAGAALAVAALSGSASAQESSCASAGAGLVQRCHGPSPEFQKPCCTSDLHCIKKDEHYGACRAVDTTIPDGWDGTILNYGTGASRTTLQTDEETHDHGDGAEHEHDHSEVETEDDAEVASSAEDVEEIDETTPDDEDAAYDDEDAEVEVEEEATEVPVPSDLTLPVTTNSDPISTTGAAPPTCLLYTSPSPRDRQKSRMPSSA